MKSSTAASPAEHESFAELDRRIAKRTAELTAGNEQLKEDLAEHQRAEESGHEGEINLDLIVDCVFESTSIKPQHTILTHKRP